MVPKLVCIAGPQRGREFKLTTGAVRVGRHSDNEISIADPKVSRYHCRILPDDSQFRLIDLDSHNGTLINNVPVRQRTLEHGDEIRVGSSVFMRSLIVVCGSLIVIVGPSINGTTNFDLRTTIYDREPATSNQQPITDRQPITGTLRFSSLASHNMES